jgi:hypothetical protein
VTPTQPVLRWGSADRAALRALLGRFGIVVHELPAGAPIPASYWGDCEAGLTAAGLYLRSDTPVHSVLHEGCHYVCMDGGRRSRLRTDAGGDTAEEDAVCYLQILLAGELAGVGCDQIMADMDAWGYTFRLGSARAWFEGDAEEARDWLLGQGLIDPQGHPTWRVRQA